MLSTYQCLLHNFLSLVTTGEILYLVHCKK